MPSYKYNGNTYDIPADKVADFEAKYQNATMAYKDGETVYDIPVNMRDKFLSKYPNAIQWDDQTQKDTLETNLADFTARYGDFMSEYENFENRLKAPEMEPEYLPNYEAHMAQADEYSLRRSERDKLLKEYFSNPLVIKEREGRAGDARLMAESFAAAAGRMEQDNPELAKKAKASNAAAMNPRGGMIGFIGDDVKQYNEDYANYETARRFAEEAQEIYAAPSKYDDSVGVANFLKGAKDVANSADFWTMGMSGIADNLNARDALAKVQEKLGSIDNLSADNISQVLSPSEAALVTAWAANVDAQARRAEDLSRGYQAGQGATESLGFMAQFLLTGGAGNYVSEAATKGMTKWLAGQLGKMSAGAVKNVTKGAAKGVLGTVKSLTKAAVQTPLMPSTYGNISEVMLEIDNSGKLIEADKAFWTGLADSMIETWSESAGGMVEEILGVPLNLGNKIWNKALGETSFGKWGQSLTRTPAYNLMKQAGWNGYIGELGEEWLGNSVRTLTGLDPNALKDFATVDQQIITMTSFAPMAVLGFGASAAQHTAAKNRAVNAAEALSGVLQQAGYSQDQISFILDDMNASTPRQLSETLTPVVNQIAMDTGFGSEAFKAVMNYADAMAKYRTLDGFYQREQESKMLDARGDIESKTGQLFYQIHDTGKPSVSGDGNVYIEEVRVVENSDGSRFFVVGQSEDGTLAAVDEEGGKRFITEDEITKQLENGTITADETMMLRDFLRAEVVRNKQVAEQARMTEESRNAVARIRQVAQPGTEVNLGTVESPVMGVIAQTTPDGVIVQTEAGVSQLSWEEVGRVLGIDATPRTDEEIEAGEVAQIEAARAERMTRLAQTTDEAAGAEIEAIDAQMEERASDPLPLKQDGSVDQTTLWNQDPERWAEWNDEQRQDGGVNSLGYINGAIAREEAAVAELTAAYDAEPDFDTRASMEQQIAANTERLQRLVNLRDGYLAQAEAAQIAAEEVAENTAPQMSEQEMASAEEERRKPIRKRAQELSKKLGVTVNIAENLSDVKEAAAREQILMTEMTSNKKVPGWFNPATGEVTVYLPHAKDTKDLEATIIHEVVAHKGIRGLLGEEGFNVLCDSVWEMMTEEERQEYLAYPGVNGNKRAAADEYIAHYAETLDLESSKPVWDRILNLITRILNTMGINLEMTKDQLSDIIVASYQKLAQDALADSVEEVAESIESTQPSISEEQLNAPNSGEASQITAADGEVIADTDGNGKVRFSIRTWLEGGRDYLAAWLAKDITLAEDEKADILARMDEFYKNALLYSDSYAPFGTWSEAGVRYDNNGNPLMSVIKANGDYAMNLDFSLVCKKRRPLNRLLRTLVNRNAFSTYTLRERELAEINWILQEHGFEVACALCFVDSKRYRVTGVADVFASLYNRLVKSIAPKGVAIAHFNYSNNPNVEQVDNGLDTLPDEQLNWAGLDKALKGKKEGSVEYKVAQYLREHPEARRLVDATDFIEAEGFESVKENNPDLLKFYNMKKGTGGPKASFGDVQYLNDILKNERAFSSEKAYSVGGVRLQSFSDFVPHMYFDYMQLFAELAAKKLPVHAYTKEVLFAKIFGLTGAKINLSLVPAVVEGGVAPGLDAEGNYAWADPVRDAEGSVIQQGQTFPFDEAMAIQNAEGYSKNCGAIAVGISDAHIEKMLDDPNIQFIIPYHKSSLNAIVARMTNIDQYKDYTNVQNTRKSTGSKLDKGTKDFNFNEYLHNLGESGSPQQAAQAYLDWCRENGFVPKFSQFAYHPNYYKLLVDFNTIDTTTGEYAPQGPVSMIFPTEQSAFGNVEALIQQGLQEDAELEEKLETKINSIADQVLARLAEISKEPKLSEKQQAKKMAELADERMAKIQAKAEGPIDVLEEARKIVEREDGIAFRVISDENYEMAQRIINNLAGDTYFRRLGGEYELGKLASNYAELADIIMAIDANKNYTPVGTALLGFFAENPEMHFPLLFNDTAVSKETAKAFKEELSKVNDPYALFFFKEAWRIHKKNLEQRGLGVKTSSTTKYNKAIDARAEEIKAAEVKGTAFNFKKQESSLDEIDAVFKQLNKDPELALLHDRVMDVAKKLGVKVSFAGKRGNTAGESLGDKVSYDYKFFNSPAVADEKKCNTITHELIHSITVYAIFLRSKAPSVLSDGMLEAVEILHDVYNQIARDPAFKGEYGVSDVYEMVAELSNAQFRDKLKEKNLFQRILDALKKLLGIDTVKEDSAYQVLSDTLNYIIDNYDQAAFDAYALYASKNKSYGRMMKIEEAPRFRIRTEEEREKLFADAKEKYGVTDNFNAAGYMLPDGSLLDFSEANDGGDPNSRSLDHRDIEGVIMDNGVEYDSRWMYIADFMKEGAIRLLPESAGINMIQAPTEEQRKKIFDFIYKYNGEVILEINDERLNSIAYMEYDRRTSPSRIFRDIDGYFNNGIVPQQDIRFRMSNNNQAIFVSNAARAVEGIKQEKATPEQWLKMIEKNGGLKAGEDKWMGLSDFLKASKAKTLTKQEVLDYINENMIIIEEQHYSDEEVVASAHKELNDKYPGWEDAFSMEWDSYMDEPYASIWDNETAVELYNDTHEDQIELDEDGEFENLDDESKVMDFGKELAEIFYRGNSDVRPIHGTRSGYQTRGLSDNHEIALTVPTIESWKADDAVHFGDAGDGRAIAWIRFGETKYRSAGIADEIAVLDKAILEYEGETSDEEYKALVEKKHSLLRASRAQKVLVIDEIQSNRHQEGRKRGYKPEWREMKRLRENLEQADREVERIEAEIVAKYGSLDNVTSAQDYDTLKAAMEARREARLELNNPRYGAIPDAPFEKNWAELAMKRMLRYAAENGFDIIAWTTGDQQANRYDLSRDVIRISAYKPNAEGERIVTIYYRDEYNDYKSLVINAEGKVIQGDYNGSALADVVGKEMSLQIMNAEDVTEFKGDGLKIGGEGMRGFYDKMLPAFMNKYGKKWGVKVEDINLPNLGKSGYTMHSVPVTEEMKSSVMEGQVMFRMRGENESAEDFLNNELGRFRGQYSTNAKMAIVDYTNRESIARTLGISSGELSDDLYNRIMAAEKKSDAVYLSKYNTIAIFAREEANTSGKADNIFFHENVHEFLKDNPHWLNLGQWLLDNSNSGPKKAIAERVKSFYPEQDHAEEMLCNYTGLMLSLGRSQAVMNSLPEEMKPIWEEILNKFNYNPEYEDSRRKSDRSGDEDARRDASVQMRNASDERARGARVTWTRNDSDLRFRTTEITPEVRDEMAVIAATALVNGNYMKAPNGADTNLTAEQWAMVRTKNFKNWFGDWENDPENASKVVDENGEPMVVYHGTGYEGNVFTSGFFASDEQFATDYGFAGNGFNARVVHAFINMRNPKIVDANYANYDNIDLGRRIVSSDELVDETREEGKYDGLIIKNVDERSTDGISWTDDFIPFSPSQIKSAIDNTGAFSEGEGDIRYRVNENPTEAQKEAGNYKMGHLNLDGYRITIENPKGSIRRGTDSKGNAWENTLNNDYGYIRGTEGVDGDHIDVYLSDNPSEGNVFVVDQVNPQTREFDEHKVMYGFNSAEEAREAYLANFSEGWNGLGTITEVSKDEFKKWIESSHRKTKPFSEYKSVKTIGAQSEGEEIEDDLFPSTGTPTENVVAEGVSLSPAQLASLAGDIFAALPEDSRKKITDGLNGNILNLQNAILQIPTSLATKENWNDEDRQMAEVVAEQMTKAVGIEMTRPFSASEALWALYNTLNPTSEYDIVAQASRALVQRNLGFDAATIEMEKDARDGVRFRTVSDANTNATASLYNRGAANVWTRLKETYVDMHASVEELVKSIEKRSGKVAQGFENIIMALNQQASKGLAAMESYTQKFLNPMFDEIRDIMDKAKVKYEDVVRYVILKHGLERNKKLAQRDAKAHYQEIYDNIIAKINSMDDRQKRTYLTNAQLQEADAKAKLASLQAVDMSTLTDEQKKDHKRELAKARVAVKEAEEHLEIAKKIRSMSEQEAKDELDKIFKRIEKGTDSVYKELRKNDYSGLSSMFYDQLGVDRKNFSTEEQYQAALMLAKEDKYKTLADVEAAAEAEVTAFESKADTKELWKRINAATKETLRQQYDANMISKDQYLNLRDMFEYYVPLRGFADNTAEDMYTYYRRPNSTGYTKPILGAEGRKTEAESPFGWIAAMAGSAIASNVKNEAKLALYYFVSNRPENGIATISKTWFVDSGEVDERGKKIFKPAYPPFSEDLSSAEGKAQYEIWQANMKELQKKGQAYEAGQRLNLGNAVVNISDKNKPEHIVNVKVGGKDYTIVINGNPRAAQAINGDLNIEASAQDYSSLFGPILRWMSSVNTSYNPEFWITNMMRDMAFTWMAVNIKEDPAYRRKFRKNYAKAFKVIRMNARNEKGTIGDSYIENMYKDFVKYGGVTGYTQIKDSETWEKEIEKYLKSNAPGDKGSAKVMRSVKDAAHGIHRIGESLEQVSRFAAFLTARETGKSINDAINDAKEITVNFNRKGSGKMITLEEAKYLTNNNGQRLSKPQQWMAVALSSISPLGRRFIMFFNAAIQGLNATYKLWKKNPSRFKSWALGYAMVGMMNAVLHAMLDDDDDYLDIPQYERRNSLMIGGNGAYFKWALPQEARVFYALGDLAVESVMGRSPQKWYQKGSTLGQALKISTEILPVNPTEGWKAFMPSVAIPFIELALNEDYKGDPIYNEQKWLSDEERSKTAKWSKAYQGTGVVYKGIAQGLNFITGGDKYDAGFINLQPEKMEHIVQSAFGGTIRTADKFINTIMAAFNPEEDVTVRQFPFLNRFLTINDERFRNVHVNDVYDYYKAEAEHVATLQKQYAKDRNRDALNDLKKSDEFKWAQIYSKYKKPIQNIQEKIKVADGTVERMELMKQQDELKRQMIKEISQLP